VLADTGEDDAGAVVADPAKQEPLLDKFTSKDPFIPLVIPSTSGGDGNGTPPKVVSATLKDLKTGESYDFPTDGVFVFVGHTPNSELFRGQLTIDEAGYVLTNRRYHTSVPGVFAAGEIQDPVFRQVVTSAGQGAAAAMQAEKFLGELEAQSYQEVAAEHGPAVLVAA
jgi:thioredoxin reductase (NADPH)